MEDEEAVMDARRWGMGEAEIQALKQHLGSVRHAGTFSGVWPANVPAVNAFLAAASQWNTTLDIVDGRLRTMWIGLDYAGAAIAWAARGIELTAELHAGIQIIEMAAREAMNGANA